VSVLNPKAQAWDAVGLQYYFLGRKSGKPTARTIRWFTKDLGPDSRCLVVGGTSVAVIRAALKTGCHVDVIDFSERVCRELARVVPAEVAIANGDILTANGDGTRTHVFCDALINRFDDAESRRFMASVKRLLVPGGTLRATVKLGHYPMDLRLLAMTAGQPGPAFWDEATRTIDYGRLGDLLERGYARHGGIPREALLGWYRNRGREKRFEQSDLRELFGPPEWTEPDIEQEAPGSDRVLVQTRRAR
jgi:SAM-dependent methyltransferase